MVKEYSTRKKIAIVALIVVPLIIAMLGVFVWYMLESETRLDIKFSIDGVETVVDWDENKTLGELETPTKFGYTFDGWYKDPALQTKYQDTTKFKKSMTIYPKFSANKYSINYYKNDGSGEVESADCFFDARYTVSNSLFTREHYNFIGWSDSETYEDGDTIYTPGDRLTLTTEGMSFYVIWQGESQTITYSFVDARVDGALPSVEPAEAYYGEQYTIPEIEGFEYKDEFKVFDGFTIRNGDGTKYFFGDSFEVLRNVVLEENWRDLNFIVYFNLGDDSLTPIPPQTSTEDSLSFVIPMAPDRANYSFKEWNTNANGYGNTYASGQTFTATQQTTTLYAIWLGNSRTIRFDGNGSTSGSVSSISARYGQNRTLPINSFVKTDYEFVSWNTKADGTGTTYAANQSIVVDFDDTTTTLYAQWRIGSVHIRYSANGGTGAIGDTYAERNSTINLPASGLTRQYYEFIGWSTESNATTGYLTYDIGSVSNIQFYAVWRRCLSTVSYNANNGTAPNPT